MYAFQRKTKYKYKHMKMYLFYFYHSMLIGIFFHVKPENIPSKLLREKKTTANLKIIFFRGLFLNYSSCIQKIHLIFVMDICLKNLIVICSIVNENRIENMLFTHMFDIGNLQKYKPQSVVIITVNLFFFNFFPS